MIDHESETRRIPKPHRPASLTDPRLRPEAVYRYASLEFPRESVTWLLHPTDPHRPEAARRRSARRRLREWIFSRGGS